MKADYSMYDLCEVVEYNGKKMIQYTMKGAKGVSTLENPGNDYDLTVLKSVALWPLPGDLYSAGGLDCEFYFDWEDPSRVMTVLKNVATEIKGLLERSLFFKDSRYSSILTCFILDSYFLNEFNYCPRLIIAGVSGSGKSTLQSILTLLCYRGYNVVSLTPASIYRTVDPYGVTTIIDESQHMGLEVKNSFDQLFKIGDCKDCPLIVRNTSVGNGYIQEGFYTYAPMAISIKPGTFEKEDIENRSFRLTMERCSEPRPEPDRARMKELRTCLYRLRYEFKLHPEVVSFKESYAKMYEWMDKMEIEPEDCERARKEYPALYGLKEIHGKLAGRTRDIAGVYGTLSQLFGGFDDIITTIYEMDNMYREKDRDTAEGRIFTALLDLINGSPFNKLNVIYSISTREIKDHLIIMTEDAGNTSRYDTNITANKITHTLKDLGFRVGPGTGNKSFIKPDPTIESTFLRCVKMYCDDDEIFRYVERLSELTPTINRKLIAKN